MSDAHEADDAALLQRPISAERSRMWRRIRLGALVGGVFAVIAIGAWLRMWSPRAYELRARALVAANRISDAEGLLQDGIVLHQSLFGASSDRVKGLQAALLRVYTKAQETETLQQYLALIYLPPEYADDVVDACATIGKDHFEAGRWQESYDWLLRAGSQPLGEPGYAEWSAAEALINAVIAACNGRMYPEAKDAMRRYIEVVVEYDMTMHNLHAVELVREHTEIRPANFDELEARVSRYSR